MSSTVLTQLPGDGELAWFNHPFTHTDDHRHTARRQVHGCSIVTALSPHQIMVLYPPPIHRTETAVKTFFFFRWTPRPDYGEDTVPA